MTERLHFHFSLSCIGEGNGNPLQCSCLENPRDGRAWWAAVCGVAQSWTRLKRLGSSSSRGAWVYFWAFYLVPLICVSDLHQYHTVLMPVALWCNLKSGRLTPPALFFFLKTALAIRGLLCFHLNCEIFCSSSVKNAIVNLIGITLNL